MKFYLIFKNVIPDHNIIYEKIECDVYIGFVHGNHPLDHDSVTRNPNASQRCEKGQPLSIIGLLLASSPPGSSTYCFY